MLLLGHAASSHQFQDCTRLIPQLQPLRTEAVLAHIACWLLLLMLERQSVREDAVMQIRATVTESCFPT